MCQLPTTIRPQTAIFLERCHYIHTHVLGGCADYLVHSRVYLLTCWQRKTLARRA